jgi:hypothetical protein
MQNVGWVVTALWASGAVLLVLAMGLAARRLLLLRRGVMTQGTVVELEEQSSGPHRPIVSFTPAGDAVTSDGRVLRFSTNVTGGGERYKVGQTVPVVYDPNHPAHASIATRFQLWGGPALTAMPAAILFTTAAIMWLVSGPLHAKDNAAKATAEEFTGYVRAGEQKKAKGLCAPGATIDEVFLQREVPKSTRLEIANYVRGFDDSVCLSGLLMPNRVPLVMALELSNEEWRVVRAAHTDSDCDERLEP